MLGPRWRKVFRDIWGAKSRSALVVLSISVGVFAVGMIGSAREMLARELTASYQASSPSSAVLLTDPLSDELVRSVRGMREVRDAQGQASAIVRIQVAPGQWRNLQLVAFADYDDIRLDKVEPEIGAWPPPERELLLERASAGSYGFGLGSVVTIETPGGKQRRMRVAGIAHDASRGSPSFGGVAYGYVTNGTLDWRLGLAGTMGLNVLERRREIGVMRAIGAGDGAVRGVIVVEGIVVGLVSWLAGAIVALPMSWLLSNAVGLSLLRMPLNYTYAPGGALAWLAVAMALATVASLAPARSAIRLTVREVLAYE